jgi:FKBP-type peptidyl-prolyl cis-trans isomerase
MKKISTSQTSLFKVIVGSALLIALVGCTKKENQNGGAPQVDATAQMQNTQPTNLSAVVTPPGGGGELKAEDPVVGTGDEAKPGKKVTVHYTGWLTDGKEFDSSKKSGRPFEFQIGAGQVIQGWERGVVGMKVGGKRKLTIPSQLGYGERGAGGVIPPNATLVFEIELLKVE